MANEGVVLLHGIFRTYRSMAGFARYLEQQGYDVLNVDYPSTKHPIEVLADIIHPKISIFSNQVEKLHFVGYSMGGLLIRAYIHKYRPEKLERVVMVGTPNKGSEVADFLKGISLYQKLYGPAGQQLITEQMEFIAHLGDIHYPLGVIAGNRPIDPISSRIIKIPNDGKVSIESTKIAGMKDHITIPCSHTFLPSSKMVWSHTLDFMLHEAFSKN